MHGSGIIFGLLRVTVATMPIPARRRVWNCGASTEIVRVNWISPPPAGFHTPRHRSKLSTGCHRVMHGLVTRAVGHRRQTAMRLFGHRFQGGPLDRVGQHGLAPPHPGGEPGEVCPLVGAQYPVAKVLHAAHHGLAVNLPEHRLPTRPRSFVTTPDLNSTLAMFHPTPSRPLCNRPRCQAGFWCPRTASCPNSQ